MNERELVKVLRKHRAYLLRIKGVGQKTDLRRADLRRADLQGADLQGANLQGANLRRADLQGADLRWANLQGADLRWADPQGANLQGADLQGADLRWADLDLSSGIPFSCKGTKIKVCDRLVAQMLFHLTRQDTSGCSGGVQEAMEHIKSMAISDLFCEYRGDIDELPTTDGIENKQ